MQNTCLQRHSHVQGHGTGRKLTVRPHLWPYSCVHISKMNTRDARQWNCGPHLFLTVKVI